MEQPNRNNIDDDAQSISSKCSTVSMTNEKMMCNFCKEEIQQRVIFNHLRKKHAEDFMFNIDAPNLKKAIKLKTYYDMDLLVPDERDETETRMMKIYCVFGTDYKTNKGYLSYHSADKYIKKNPEVLKEHLKQMNILLKIKEDNNKKKTNILTRGSIPIQINLKQAYRFITYAEQPLTLLAHKNVNTSKEVLRQKDLLRQFNELVKSLPTNPNKVVPDSQAKALQHLHNCCRGFFDGLVGWIDRVYEYPVWVDTLYLSCCTEHNPAGQRLGEERDWFNYLTYPGDITD